MQLRNLVSNLDVITGVYGDLQLEIVAPGLSDLSSLNELPTDKPKEIVGVIRILAPRGYAGRNGPHILSNSLAEQGTAGAKTIALVENGTIRFIRSSEIQVIEAEGNYVRIQKDAGSTLLRDTIACVASKLAPLGFIRVHRSLIINAEHIREIESLPHGKNAIVTNNGNRYTVSRSYRGALAQLAWTAIGSENMPRQFL